MNAILHAINAILDAIFISKIAKNALNAIFAICAILLKKLRTWKLAHGGIGRNEAKKRICLTYDGDGVSLALKLPSSLFGLLLYYFTDVNRASVNKRD